MALTLLFFSLFVMMKPALERGLFKALPGFVMNALRKYACVMGNMHA
jgi:hypothetical protein